MLWRRYADVLFLEMIWTEFRLVQRQDGEIERQETQIFDGVWRRGQECLVATKKWLYDPIASAING